MLYGHDDTFKQKVCTLIWKNSHQCIAPNQYFVSLNGKYWSAEYENRIRTFEEISDDGHGMTERQISHCRWPCELKNRIMRDICVVIWSHIKITELIWFKDC